MGLQRTVPKQAVQLSGCRGLRERRVEEGKEKSQSPRRAAKEDSCKFVLSKSNCDVYWAVSRITPARKLERRVTFSKKDLS